MRKTGCIYMYKNKVNGRCYVGQTIQTIKRRRIQHISAANRGMEQPFYKAIRKYGIDNFDFEVLLSNVPVALLDDLEINTIHMYDAYTKGYNAASGGKVNRGFTLSDVTKEKLKQANLGKKASEMTKQKMSDSQRGRKHSEDTKKRISRSNLGNYHTEATKRKMSERVVPESQKQALSDSWKRDTEGNRTRRERMRTWNIGRVQSEEELLIRSKTRSRGEKNPKSKAVRCVETGRVYSTVAAAAKEISTSTSNVSAVCKGKYKKTKGFSFEYVVNTAIEHVYVVVG